jgi:hypothetical protein
MARACKCFAALLFSQALGRVDVIGFIQGGAGELADVGSGQATLAIHLDINITTGVGEYSVGIVPTIGMIHRQPAPVTTAVCASLDCYFGTSYPGTTRCNESQVFDLAKEESHILILWLPHSTDGHRTALPRLSQTRTHSSPTKKPGNATTNAR